MVASHQVSLPPFSIIFLTNGALRFYWFRLLTVSLIWFIYDFSAYSFGIYSSTWINIILGDTAPLWKTFGWNTVVNLFYIPGAILGSFVSDWIGPRYALAGGVFAQGVVGFIMAGFYAQLATPAHVAAFVVVYGYGPHPYLSALNASTQLTKISHPVSSSP